MKELVTWSESLSVGIEEIDDQHRVLVDLLNQVYDAVVLKKAEAEIAEVIQQLNDYTRIHFALEESMMRLLGYAEYEAHKARHEKLVAELNRYAERFNEKGASISFELLQFLKDWLTKHIQESDRGYTSHFIACGAKKKNVASGNWMKRLLQR